MAIFRVDFSNMEGQYRGTQFIEAPSKSVVEYLAKSGQIYNTSSRKLKRIKVIKNIKAVEKEMDYRIIIRRLTLK